MNDDCVLTTQAMTQGLERLQVYCRDLGLEAQILPPNELWALPVLAAAVPSGRGLLLTLSWLSVPAEEAQLSRFLQFYEEFPLPEDMETPGAETMADLNRRTPLGSWTMQPEEEGQPRALGFRWVQGYSLYDDVDQGLFAESLQLFLHCGQLMTGELYR